MRRNCLPQFLVWSLILLFAATTFARHHGFDPNDPNNPFNPNNPNGNQSTTRKSATSIPAADLQALDDARSAYEDARAKSNAASEALLAEAEKLHDAAVSSPEYKAALADQTAAKAAYQAVVQPLHDAVAAKPEYKAAVVEKQRAADALRALQDDPNASSDQVTAAATAVMDAGSHLTQLDSDAISNNQNVVDAHNRELAADAKVRQLESNVTTSIHASPDWIAARTALDQDKAAEIATEQTLSAALLKVGQSDAARAAAADAAKQKQLLAKDSLQQPG